MRNSINFITGTIMKMNAEGYNIITIYTVAG